MAGLELKVRVRDKQWSQVSGTRFQPFWRTGQKDFSSIQERRRISDEHGEKKVTLDYSVHWVGDESEAVKI